MRYIGIDEAGYGPNLGPMVMVAVSAESDRATRPDLWRDLSATVSRARSGDDRVWVDDSKAILRGGKGRDRLEATAMALIAAVGRDVPSGFAGWLDAVGAGSLEHVELSPWLDPSHDLAVPSAAARSLCDRYVAMTPFGGASSWRISDVRAEVVGPSRFNAGIQTGGNKAAAHFAAFARLLGPIWRDLPPGETARVRGDKHGGRHFYLEPLNRAFPDCWIDRGEEGPELSRYTFRDRDQSRSLELTLTPRADADDGLVALASIMAKSLRERWMDVFNAYWTDRVPGLKPTAGYPVDARRFRAIIEPICQQRGLDVRQWWRVA